MNFKLTLKNNSNENMFEENSHFSHCCPKIRRNTKIFLINFLKKVYNNLFFIAFEIRPFHTVF